MNRLSVLVACEESGVVRDAFEAQGHKVLSCDLFATRSRGPHHQGDIFDVTDYPWDLAICHPPCTHTSVSGSSRFVEKWHDGRQACGVSFVLRLWKALAHVPSVALEQPVSILSSLWRKPDQIIQPWQFGHPESKSTCLWLKGLPKLTPTEILPKPECGHWQNQTPSGQNKLGPSPDRAKIRATTYRGIADAMAQQWSAGTRPYQQQGMTP